jgi:hypothetical protein
MTLKNYFFGIKVGFILHVFIVYMPIPVAARSKAWVCGRWLAGIAGSNLAGSMDICPL